MELNRQSWHTRLFFWALDISCKFTGNSSRWILSRGGEKTNLCQYVRFLLVWMPLVLGINVALVGFAIWTIVVLPINLFGITGYAWTIGTIVGVIAIIVAIVYLFKLFGWLMDKRDKAAKKSPVVRKQPVPVVIKPYTGPSFWEVLGAWMKAQKDKVCPIISFTGLKAEEEGNV